MEIECYLPKYLVKSQNSGNSLIPFESLVGKLKFLLNYSDGLFLEISF